MSRGVQLTKPNRHHVVMLFWSLLAMSTCIADGNDVSFGSQDFCEGESFRAKCTDDKVIVMREAVYGRMRLGRCVKVDMGYLGCQTDVLDLADGRCSGRQQCNISVPDTTFEKRQPCLELKSYLQASFVCLKVVPVDLDECRRSRVLRVTSPSGYIASALSYQSRCGTSASPWLIQALPGQRINLTLLNFSGLDQDSGGGLAYGDSFNGVEVCQKYAMIREEIPERSTVLCGGRAREQHVYLSNSNTVRVEVEARHGSRNHFVLKFQVQGCPDPDISANTWFKRENNEITIGCKDSDETWHVTCRGTHWVGAIGNCSRGGEGPTSSLVTGHSAIIPRKLVIVTVCGIAFVVGVLILMVGIFFFRKYKHRPHDAERPVATTTTVAKGSSVKSSKHCPHQRAPPAKLEEVEGVVYPEIKAVDTLKDTRRRPEDTHAASPMYMKGQSRNDYTHIWEMPLPTPSEDSG